MNASRLDTHLEHAASLPAGLVAHAQRLAKLNRSLRDWLLPQGAWAAQVSLANIRPPLVTLIAHNAATATRLRYSQQGILSWLSEQTDERFTRLEISVRSPAGSQKGGV